jgi:hypothetical protein
VVYQVNGSRVERDPAAARWRELTEEMPDAPVTEFGNVNVKTRSGSCGTRSTYLVDDSADSRGQAIIRAEYERAAALQDARIAASRMVVASGLPGRKTSGSAGPAGATAARPDGPARRHAGSAQAGVEGVPRPGRVRVRYLG